MGHKLAIVGATGNVGRELLATVAESEIIEVDEIYALASRKSVNREVSYGDDHTLKVLSAEDFDFSKVDIVLASAGSTVSKDILPKAAAAGAVVIDNGSYWRMDPDVPLVVPEVNPQALKGFAKKNIIANPNCSTIQLVMALKPLNELAKIKRVVVSTYQSVSGAGKKAMDELFDQTRHVYMNQPTYRQEFTKNIAFNVIPQIDVFMDDGDTKEEWKMRAETKKILDEGIELTATCVRVPVFVGHAEAVNIEFDKPVSVDDAREALREMEGVLVVDNTEEDGGYVTPSEIAGDSGVYVSRLRQDPSNPNALNMWVVADNLRKGAALNTVQIAEKMITDGLI